MMRFLPLIVFIALIALLAGVLQQENAPRIIKTDVSPMVGERPTLPALTPLGHAKPFSTIRDESVPVVVNLFASWCTPCLAEHPLLQTLQASGATLYGIGWRDSEENIVGWLEEHGSPFSAVWLDEEGEVAIPLGLRGVPETYIIYKGEVLFHHAGVLTEQIVQGSMMPLLEVAHD